MRTKKVRTRPRCRYCNRPLWKFTIGIDAWEPIAVGDTVAHPWQEDRHVPVLQITRQSSLQPFNEPRTRYGYSIWYGAYGVDGENLFCTKTCGYRYARRLLQDKE